jgi:hypothetical protein
VLRVSYFYPIFISVFCVKSGASLHVISVPLSGPVLFFFGSHGLCRLALDVWTCFYTGNGKIIDKDLGKRGLRKNHALPKQVITQETAIFPVAGGVSFTQKTAK